MCFGFSVRDRGSGGQEGEEGNCETEELHLVFLLANGGSTIRDPCGKAVYLYIDIFISSYCAAHFVVFPRRMLLFIGK
jgi:hypothetical protein